ncbi:MAG: hypothetical protein JNM17_04130 [Archangium sp.]|nr:hypothetical protein [Archangium sp.]
MAELKRRWTWKKWAPDLGENREVEGGPLLFLDIATGLTAAQLQEAEDRYLAATRIRPKPPELTEAMTAAERADAFSQAASAYRSELCAALGSAFSPCVRVHDGPHTVDGKPLANMDHYFALLIDRSDFGARHAAELFAAVRTFNSLSGPDELFSLRSSGGARSTDDQRTAKDESPTASH